MFIPIAPIKVSPTELSEGLIHIVMVLALIAWLLLSAFRNWCEGQERINKLKRMEGQRWKKK